MTTRERVQDFIRRVEAGDFLGAFEEFYADDVVMRENKATPVVGKAANREREKAFVAAIRTLHRSRARSVVIDGDRVAINWDAEYTFGDGTRLHYDQIAFQTWKDGRIVEETFFYDAASLAA